MEPISFGAARTTAQTAKKYAQSEAHSIRREEKPT